ncbi:MAG TPA: hypothetical protein PKO06_04365 [Candidatus Ozemobacteraceae bacterium]|nr:hypothetical protein [Candidatus Ozemobacteraceae bacterium]
MSDSLSTEHDFAIPRDGSLFNPIDGPRGRRLALVFGNEAPGGRCPFHTAQCSHCDLGAGEGIRFTTEINVRRLTFFTRHYAEIFPMIEHLVIYNSGSTLNPLELSLDTLQHILAFAASLPKCRRVSFDTREDFVTPERVARLADGLRSDQQFGLTLGVESQNDHVRMQLLGKSMSREEVAAVFQHLSRCNPRSRVEMNVVFQPPGLTGQAAVDDALATIRFGLELMDQSGVPVDFNFHPYYPSWKGTREFPNHPRANLQDTLRALILIHREIRTHGGDSAIFVGWNDEGHDLQPSSKSREINLYQPGIVAFNRSQDEADLHL